MPAAATRNVPASATTPASASTTSSFNPGACAASTSRWVSGEKSDVSPGCGARFSATSRFADVDTNASASSGTSRCGSTLVNQDPGPNTTQSASHTAATASAHAGGRAGTSETLAIVPGA